MNGSPIPEDTILLVHDGAPLPSWLEAWMAEAAPAVLACADEASVVAYMLRAHPRAVVLDGRCGTADAYALCRRLKADSWTAIVPIVLLDEMVDHPRAFAAGADEVLPLETAAPEATARLTALLRRSDRDTDVHPSTRLPGTRAIEAELRQRLSRQELFAACYADLDHFKEFNDRYGFYQGNEVIRLVARVLHDAVKGLCGEAGFVGHIGGDDFLYIVPVVAMPRVCDEVIRRFDELAPLRYSEADRRAGYFMGKDRRNQLHRVPLMTLSVGVVTNQRRRFSQPAEISELASEMKTYAKTQPGSVWIVDRRRDDETGEAMGRVAPVRPEPWTGAPAAGASTGGAHVTIGSATVLQWRPRGIR
jgi:diguanylate cyclase (GGDEF)-like protein